MLYTTGSNSSLWTPATITNVRWRRRATPRPTLAPWAFQPPRDTKVTTGRWPALSADPEPSGDGGDRRRAPQQDGRTLEAGKGAHPQLQVLDRLPVGVLVANDRGRVTEINRAWTDISGLNLAQSAGTGWLSVFEHPVRRRVLNDVTSVMENGEEATQDYPAAIDSFQRWMRCHLLPCLDQADPMLFIAVTDITADYQREAEFRRQANHDPLTGLINKQRFLHLVRLALTRHDQGGVVVGFVDLDGFKNVNDSRGHAHGDRVLTAVANRLERIRRQGDTVARIGGDEFGLLWDDLVPPFKTETLMERIRDAFEEPFQVDGSTWRISPAVGVSVSKRGATAEGLLADADKIMYDAKKARLPRHLAPLGEGNHLLRIITALDDLAARTDDLADSAKEEGICASQLLDAAHSIHRAIVSLEGHLRAVPADGM